MAHVSRVSSCAKHNASLSLSPDGRKLLVFATGNIQLGLNGDTLEIVGDKWIVGERVVLALLVFFSILVFPIFLFLMIGIAAESKTILAFVTCVIGLLGWMANACVTKWPEQPPVPSSQTMSDTEIAIGNRHFYFPKRNWQLDISHVRIEHVEIQDQGGVWLQTPLMYIPNCPYNVWRRPRHSGPRQMGTVHFGSQSPFIEIYPTPNVGASVPTPLCQWEGQEQEQEW